MSGPTRHRSKTAALSGLTFQDVIFHLSRFWANEGCVLALPYDMEVGAGTMCPETFLRVLGPKPWRVAYVQPSRRPADGRYGENPNRLLKHTQMQVILKPPPENIQDVYLTSLTALGINLREHDIRFEEDNWEAPTLGAGGIGWQVVLDGLEITQFTYFQQCGGMDLDPVSVELTYGLERIAAFLQGVDSVYDLKWDGERTYGEMRQEEELQLSVYDFELADAKTCRELLGLYEGEAERLVANFLKTSVAFGGVPLPAASGGTEASAASGGIPLSEASAAVEAFRPSPWAQAAARFPLLKVYEFCLKCSHLFNILDARGAISVAERVALIGRIRNIARQVATLHLQGQGAETDILDTRVVP